MRRVALSLAAALLALTAGVAAVLVAIVLVTGTL